MGACIGKKNSKYHNRSQSQSYINKTPQPKTQDDVSGNKSSQLPSEKLPVTDDLSVNNDDEWRLSQLDENGIDLEVQLIIDEQEIINEVFSQLFPSGIISVTETELEYELANLMYEHPENDTLETLFTALTDKPKDV